MPNVKKYGAFAGVFTPSLLTILGVIMYLRLGWVVGQAGLVNTIAIILIAHIISVTTGLSISSIATDKKIKTGGIYYILSRSLGLPMGGAIGISLFIATALSISLYIVGFAENFLSIDFIRNLTGLEQDINGYRIVGTATIIFLVVVAFISTSLAMRMQFFILIAIVLSLFSIFAGMFTHIEYHPETVNLFGEGTANLELVFAIFFPAVTGFTAGVAMSGDLINPKKDIPKGTILAILTGLIVYITLAVSIAYFIDPAYLLNDYNILVKIGLISPLVIAGIWGATLSSALGGILGGPRILQAIAIDKIAPKIFAKGFGDTNEPRNALLLIFAIAEGGILIGKLDVIAGVVSMFYLASYGFINLAYVLEKWASSDFRPSYKVHISVGIIGFVASFAVMFKLNMGSMFAALLIMGLIYLWLKRKEIKSEHGDVWQSVWTSVMRRALHKMSNKEVEERNWKPNILLFSGGTQKRPYLLEFGQCLVGKHGMLSNFDLVENKNLNVLFSKHEQNVKNTEFIPGVFTRQQSCRDIYEGIEIIARTYGFSGIEPNTILMGWGNKTENPEKFVKLLKTLNDLDYNLLLMDYDKNRGFGKRKQIDIWAKDEENYGNLALTLTKFLTNHKLWENAKVRLLIVNHKNSDAPLIKKKADNYIDKLRIDAEVIVVNNEIEKKSLYELIKIESYHSDLVFVGLPEIKTGKEKDFISETTELFTQIGTVIFVKASSVFKQLQFGINSGSDNSKKLSPVIKAYNEELKPELPKNKKLAEAVENLFSENINNYKETINQFFEKITDNQNNIIDNISELTQNALNNLKLQIEKYDNEKLQTALNNNFSNIFIKTNKLVENHINDSLKDLQDIFNDNLIALVKQNQKIIDSCPKKIKISYTKDELKVNKDDSFQEKFFKFRRRTLGIYSYKVRFRELVKTKIELQSYKDIYKYLKSFGLLDIQYIIEIQKLVEEINNKLILLSLKVENKEINNEILTESFDDIQQKINEIKDYAQKFDKILFDNYVHNVKTHISALTKRLNRVNCNKYVVEINHKKKIKAYKKRFSQIPEKWGNNNLLMNNALSSQIKLFSFENKIKSNLLDLNSKINSKIKDVLIKELKRFSKFIEKIKENPAVEEIFKPTVNEQDIDNITSLIDEKIDRFISSAEKSISGFPEKIQVIDSIELNDFEKNQFENIKAIKINASQLLEYLVANKIENPLLKEYAEIKSGIEQSFDFYTDTKRLIEFSISDYEKDKNTAGNKEILKLIEEKSKKIKSEINFLEELCLEATNQNISLINVMSHELKYYVFIKTASNLKHYVAKQEISKHKFLLRLKLEKISGIYSDKLSGLIFAKSRALNLKKDIEQKENSLYSLVNSILEIKNKISPDKKVLNEIPLYYRQLFENKKTFHKEFWVNRAKELESAKQSINNYYSGYKGAIAIIGEPGSGKSFFANYISKNYNKTKNVFYIKPPASGSLEYKDFEKALQNELMEKAETEGFKIIEKDSVVVLDDFELWWEKSPNGNKLVEKIFNLIDIYNKKLLFVISINSFAVELIFKLNPVKDLFINIIYLKNLGSETLKDIILLRHKSSGMRLVYKNKKLTENSKITTAKLFNKYYKYSGGNIDTALNLWISNIEKYENETIYSNFKNINTAILHKLDTESMIYLAQFFIHKKLTISKICNIMQVDKKEAVDKIKFLNRAGIINKHSKIYYIDKYMSAPIIKVLKEKGILK